MQEVEQENNNISTENFNSQVSCSIDEVSNLKNGLIIRVKDTINARIVVLTRNFESSRLEVINNNDKTGEHLGKALASIYVKVYLGLLNQWIDNNKDIGYKLSPTSLEPTATNIGLSKCAYYILYVLHYLVIRDALGNKIFDNTNINNLLFMNKCCTGSI